MKKDNTEITGLGHKGDGTKENPHVARDFGPQPSKDQFEKHMHKVGIDDGMPDIEISIRKKIRETHGFRYLVLFWLGGIWISLADTIGTTSKVQTYGFWEIVWTGIVIGAFTFAAFMAGRESKK